MLQLPLFIDCIDVLPAVIQIEDTDGSGNFCHTKIYSPLACEIRAAQSGEQNKPLLLSGELESIVLSHGW